MKSLEGKGTNRVTLEHLNIHRVRETNLGDSDTALHSFIAAGKFLTGAQGLAQRCAISWKVQCIQFIPQNLQRWPQIW